MAVSAGPQHNRIVIEHRLVQLYASATCGSIFFFCFIGIMPRVNGCVLNYSTEQMEEEAL
jgi:hypothetical protein